MFKRMKQKLAEEEARITYPMKRNNPPGSLRTTGGRLPGGPQTSRSESKFLLMNTDQFTQHLASEE
jgi:hypothetical protein